MDVSQRPPTPTASVVSRADAGGTAPPNHPPTAGIHVGNVNKSIIADTVQNAQDVNFESTKGGGAGLSMGYDQSILAQKVDIQGGVTYTSKTRHIYHSSATPLPSGPKDAFSSSPFEFDIKQHQYLRAAQQSPGSGRWLLDSQDFIDWEETSGVRKLCLVGGLGAGKTVLVSTVIHHLRVKYSSKDFACLYVYFDYAEQKQQTYEKLLAHLLYQLLRLRDGVTPEVQAAFENMTTNNIPPGPDEYIDMIKSEIRTFTRVFVVVDALDECLDEPPEHIASNLVRALDQLPKRTRILFTSRPMTTMDDGIKADKRITVQTDVNGIAAYFKNRINNTDWLKKLVEKGIQKDPRFVKKAVDTIISRSHGM